MLKKQNQNKKPQLSGKKVAKIIESGYKPDNKVATKVAGKRFKIIKKLSNDKHKVYTDKKGIIKDPIVTFPGTRVSNDYMSDLFLAVGAEKYNNRFKNSKKFIEKVKKDTGSKNLNIVGHSLGGSLAQYAGTKKDNIITVNKGAGFSEFNRNIGGRQTDIRTSGDLVSGLSSFNKVNSNKITLPNQTPFGVGQLKEHNFRNIRTIDNISFN
jgi:hypothetical protein